jgi:hypothetical protein
MAAATVQADLPGRSCKASYAWWRGLPDPEPPKTSPGALR